MPDQFDVSLEDSDLLGEVELTTNLIIAASETDEHLTDAEIDEILGRRARSARLIRRRSSRAAGVRLRRQQVAKSTGPVLRSESTDASGRGVSCITTSEPCAVTEVTRNRSSKVPPWPGAGPRASAARVSALVRATSSSANSKATRTRAVGLVGHRERRVRVHLAGRGEQLLGLLPGRRAGVCHGQSAAGVVAGVDRRRERLPGVVDHGVQAGDRRAVPAHGVHGDGEERRRVGGEHQRVVAVDRDVAELGGEARSRSRRQVLAALPHAVVA